MMPVWQVVLLLNVTLAVGLGLGYAGWGRRADRLDLELEAVRARVEQLERERVAAAAGAPAGEQQWDGRGVVRAMFPEAGLLVITHEEIPGLLPARTTSFRTASPAVRDGIRVGDAIRFSLRGKSRDAPIVAIETW
jgi:Cu/Ag efflux protein CusF